MNQEDASGHQLIYRAVAEPGKPGPKWTSLFREFWPAYAAWLKSRDFAQSPDRRLARGALRAHMPEFLSTWERMCELAGADEVAACFLSGHEPPPYIYGCSQAVAAGRVVQLARNYDFHPDLTEATLLLTAWNGKRVIANSDCLAGALDGLNEDGLAVSLAFGGRKAVGKGFGIPFILRYVLEFCRDTQDAVEALTRVPSHMAYNVTAIDRSGAFRTVELAPDRKPKVTEKAFSTNHQGAVEWPENAVFNRTLERAEHLRGVLAAQHPGPESLRKAFLESPLYNRRFDEGFGTLYTAHYFPGEGRVELHWPETEMRQSFTDFKETAILIDLRSTPVHAPAPVEDNSAMRTRGMETTPPWAPAEEADAKWDPEEKPWWDPASWGTIAQYWYEASRHFWKKGDA